MPADATQASAGQRGTSSCSASAARHLFQTLAELQQWRVPLPQAFAIAAEASEHEALRSKLSKVGLQLQQGDSLSQALQSDPDFWGPRTIAIIDRSKPDRLAEAFSRLAAGAGEPPLQRAWVTCFGISRKRTALNLMILLGLLGLGLPILPHHRDGQGSIWVLGHQGSITDAYLRLGSKASRGVWTTASTISHRDLLGANQPGGVKAYAKRLEKVTGSRAKAQCVLQSRALMGDLMGSMAMVHSLAQLEPSPVPLVWIQRILHTNAIRSQTGALSTPGEAQRKLEALANQCPEIGQHT